MLYQGNAEMEYECRNSRKHTYEERQDKSELLVRDILQSPFYDLVYLHFWGITVAFEVLH